jgi:hypothetical protein
MGLLSNPKCSNFKPYVEKEITMKKKLINILPQMVTVFLFFVSSTGLANDRFTINDVINGYEDYLRFLFPFSVEFEEKTNYNGNTINKEGVIRSDGNNFIVRLKSSESEKKEYRNEFSYYKERLLLIFNPLQPDELSLVSWLKPTPEDIDFKQYYLYPAVFGYLSFDTLANKDYIPSVLRKHSKNITIQQNTSTTSQVILMLAHEDILFEMLFDKKENFVPIKFKLSRKDNSTQLLPGQIYSFEHSFENYSNKFPKKYSYSIAYANSDLIDGIEKQTHDKYSGVVFFNHIKINTTLSKSDLKIAEPIPNYTEVSMQDAPQIQYVWLDGEIVPLTDELALARIREHGFIPGVREPRFWFIAAGAVLIFLSIFFKIKMIIQDWKKK